MRLGEREQILRIFNERFVMSRFAVRMVAMNGPAMENFTFEYKACLHASGLQLEQI